jgi:hypothetical protein
MCDGGGVSMADENSERIFVRWFVVEWRRIEDGGV